MRCGDDPTPALVAERDQLLAGTVPKREFWETVERKGTLLAEEKALAAERAKADVARDALAQQVTAAEGQLAAARDARARSAAALAEAQSGLERARAERAACEARLAEFARLQAAPEGS